MSVPEIERVKALRELRVAGTAPEPEFDRLARIVTHVANADVGHICFIDDRHQFIKAVVGADFPREIAREESICTDVVQSEKPLLIEDLTTYVRPIGKKVSQAYGLRSYVGVPITMPNGATIGVVAAMSVRDQLPSSRRIAALQDLALLTKRELLIRKAKTGVHVVAPGVQSNAVATMTQVFRTLAQGHFAVLRSIGDGVIGIRQDGTVSFVNPAAERLLGRPASTVLDTAFSSLLAGIDPGAAKKGHDAVAACLRDGKECFVRAAHFLRGSGEALRVEYVVTPISAGGESLVAFVVFREAGPSTTTGIALRESLREVARLREQIERLRGRDQEAEPAGHAGSPEAVYLAPLGIHELLAAIQREEAAQIMRASALCDGQIDGIKGAAMLLDMTADVMRKKFEGAEAVARQPSRIDRWLVEGTQIGSDSGPADKGRTAHREPTAAEAGDARQPSRVERWLADTYDVDRGIRSASVEKRS